MPADSAQAWADAYAVLAEQKLRLLDVRVAERIAAGEDPDTVVDEAIAEADRQLDELAATMSAAVIVDAVQASARDDT
jgi:hypothetical protein